MDAHYRFTVLNTELTPNTLAQWETIALADYGKFRDQPYPYLLWEPSVSVKNRYECLRVTAGVCVCDGCVCVFNICEQKNDACFIPH